MRIVSFVFLTPLASGSVVDGSDGVLADRVERLLGSGVVVCLSAADGEQAAGFAQWMDGKAMTDAASARYLRLVTPGFLRWPAGAVRMPLDADEGSDPVGRLTSRIQDYAKEAADRFRVVSDLGFVELRHDGPLAADDLENLFVAANASDTVMTTEPTAVETNPVADGGYSSVVGPVTPSEAWLGGVLLAEKTDPRELVVVTRQAEENHPSVAALRLALAQALRRLGEERPEGWFVLRADSAQETDDAEPFGSDIRFAPAIVAPSDIHFIRRWTSENQRYVRESYWAATLQATRNVEDALNLLVSLPPGRFKRTADLVTRSKLRGGQRIFDDYSGGVCFDPGHYEFELAKPRATPRLTELHNKLLGYFDQKLDEMPFDRPLLRRRMFTDSLVLMRGEAYYSNLKQTPPWERAQDFIEEAEALQALFRTIGESQELKDAVADCLSGGEASLDTWKLLLATMDQARNLGLVMLCVAAFRAQERRDINERRLVASATALVEAYYAVMLGDVRLGTGAELVEKVIEGTIKASAELNALKERERERARTSLWYEPGAAIRGWREADSPFENLLTALLATDNRRSGEKLAAIGIFWGGVELPVVVKVVAEIRSVDLPACGFIARGRYSSASFQQALSYWDLLTNGLRDIGGLAGEGISRALLLDDNALSGRTLESTRRLLLQAGIEEVETWVVRFSGERREGQMRMASGGVVHPAYLADRLKGFLFETPYARSYSRKQYESPVGVFNTARSRILRYLHNNGFASIFEREGF